jgi:protein-L-isoaspartate O-methyltransferase
MSSVGICMAQLGSCKGNRRSRSKAKLYANQSLRLDAQHLLWKLHNGYELNPRIPISPNMKIAEIGTGTGYTFFKALF